MTERLSGVLSLDRYRVCLSGIDSDGNTALSGEMMKPTLCLVVLAAVSGVVPVACVYSPSLDKKQNMIEAPTDVGGVPADAEKSASGLAWKVLQVGNGGEKPSPSSTVTVHYSGWTTDGRLFDSSVARDEKISFPLNQVIAGWTEGVGMMTVGEKRRLWIPAKLAYGEAPPRGAPKGMLVFDVELFEIH